MIGEQQDPSRGSLEEDEASETVARRAFLRNCAKFAAATPPAIALLLYADKAAAVASTACEQEVPDEMNPECQEEP